LLLDTQAFTVQRGLWLDDKASVPPRDYIDQNKLQLKREAMEKLRNLLEYGTEDDFVAAVKSWRQDITADQLKEWIRLFRDAVREKRGPSR